MCVVGGERDSLTVCVLEQDWNKALQGCDPPGTEFDTPALDYALPYTICLPDRWHIRGVFGKPV